MWKNYLFSTIIPTCLPTCFYCWQTFLCSRCGLIFRWSYMKLYLLCGPIIGTVKNLPAWKKVLILHLKILKIMSLGSLSKRLRCIQNGLIYCTVQWCSVMDPSHSHRTWSSLLTLYPSFCKQHQWSQWWGWYFRHINLDQKFSALNESMPVHGHRGEIKQLFFCNVNACNRKVTNSRSNIYHPSLYSSLDSPIVVHVSQHNSGKFYKWMMPSLVALNMVFIYSSHILKYYVSSFFLKCNHQWRLIVFNSLWRKLQFFESLFLKKGWNKPLSLSSS